MSSVDVGEVLQQAILAGAKVAAPLLIAMLAVGLIVSLLQAVTQINEATLGFVAKVAALVITMSMFGSFMLDQLSTLTLRLFDRLVAIGGS